MFTVIIPLYNKVFSIAKTIQSVLNQTLKNFELLVVNDGSTDNSVEIVERFDDHRIKIIHQSNQGVSAARNAGIKEAKGEWICFLDADDEWEPNFLQLFDTAINENKEFDFYTIGYKIIEPNGSTKNILLNNNDTYISIGIADYLRHSIKKKPLATSNTVMINSKIVKNTDGFLVGLKRGEDRDYWLRILFLTGKLCFINKVAAYYHRELPNRVSNSLIIDPAEDLIFRYEYYINNFNLNKQEIKALRVYLSYFALGRAVEYYRAGRYNEMSVLFDQVRFSKEYIVKYLFVKLKTILYQVTSKQKFNKKLNSTNKLYN